MSMFSDNISMSNDESRATVGASTPAGVLVSGGFSALKQGLNYDLKSKEAMALGASTPAVLVAPSYSRRYPGNGGLISVGATTLADTTMRHVPRPSSSHSANQERHYPQWQTCTKAK